MRSIPRTSIVSVVLVLLIALATTAHAAKEYSANRFDSRIRVGTDGALDVTETIVIRFESGTFTYFFRNIPKRSTDGIEVVAAEMDGRAMPFGKSDGEVEVQYRSPVRVRWRFAPRSGTTHTFVLTYRVRGAVRREGSSDVMSWHALPKEHEYRIASSEITVEYPVAPRTEPTMATRRVGDLDQRSGELRVLAISRAIGRNGWVEPRLEFEAGSVIAKLPAWQQRELRIAALAPRWWLAAGLVFLIGVGLLLVLRQGYDSPSRESWGTAHGETLPDTLRPALAGAVMSNGSVGLHHAMATLFALADRSEVSIAEGPRKWGQRTFVLRRTPAGRAIAPEERTLLDVAFHDKQASEETVPLDKARSRIGGRGLRAFGDAVRQQLTALGLFDAERTRIRVRYRNLSIVLLVVAAALTIPAAIATRAFGGWPFLIPASVTVVAVVGFIFQGALTPLSNEGVRRAAEWRAFQRHLRDVGRARAHLTTDSPTHVLPFAVALGLAGVWSKFMKHHHAGVPAWFQSLGAADDGAFPAFIAAGGAGADGGAGGVGVGAGASGGASGAG